jgi:uncharacterized protein DUF5681
MNDVVQAPKAHQWQPGQSGNPAGRPKNSKNAITLVKLQIEGELRAQMKDEMPAVVAKMLELALKGDRDMLKTLYKSWVSGTVASEEDAPKDKIQIVIGKLDQIPAVNGTTFKQSNSEE